MAKELELNQAYFIRVLKRMAQVAEENRDYWTQLDSAIGDGDHGINLSIGFRAIAAALPTLEAENLSINQLLKKSGMMLLGKVGGAAGPLYGSFFMKMGADIGEATSVTERELTHMLDNGLQAIKQRGKAELGDKTMIDALEPGIEHLKGYSQADDFSGLFQASIEQMKLGAERTKPLVAKKGRAMRLGERAIGHLDPGATSIWMLLAVFYQELALD